MSTPSATSRGRTSGYVDVGDYIAIDSAAGRVAAIWADARQGDPGEIRVRTGSVR